MRLIFPISRFWGRDPYWLMNMDPEKRALVIAEYYLHHDPPKKSTISRSQLKDKIRKYQDRGIDNGGSD